MAQNTLLELTTDAPERSVITIDGKPYELRARDDLGLKEDAAFRYLTKEFADAQPGQDWQKLATLLGTMVQSVVIGMPNEILEKLSDAKKLKIIEVFTKEVAMIRPAPSPERAEKEAVPA